MSHNKELREIQKQLEAVRIPASEVRNKSVAPPAVPLSAQDVKALLDRGKAIYGPDSRTESASDATLAPGVSEPVACLVLGDRLKLKAGRFRFDAPTFGMAYRLCEGQRFSEQPCLGYGTGFLVAPDVLVTAGHCVQGFDLEDINVIFGFDVVQGALRDERVQTEIYSVRDAEFEVNPTTGADWAIVKLDRPVAGITPLKVRTRPVEVGEAVYVIGHPVGLPKKVARGATVTGSGTASYFVTNLDTFGGNSGSPVFDVSNEVCGILVRGAEDFVWQGNCRVAATFPLTQGGEDVCRATVWAGKYMKHKLENLAEPRVDPSTGPDSGALRLALRAFLLSAFNATDLRQLVAFNKLLEELGPLINFDKPLGEIVEQFIAELFRRDLVGDEFFSILSRERSRRQQEIARIKALAR